MAYTTCLLYTSLKEKMDARKVLAVDLYTGVYEEEVLGAFSKEFSGRVMNVRDSVSYTHLDVYKRQHWG